MDRKVKVVITGLGLVTPLGSSPEEILARIAAKTAAFRIAPYLEPWNFAFRQIADITGFDPTRFGLDPKALRIMSRDAVFASVAARLAIRDAGLAIGKDYAPDDVALFGSTGLSGIAFEEVSQLIRHSARPDGTFDPRLFGEVALKRILPTLSFKILTNMPICFVSISENIQGMNAIYNPWEGQGARAVIAGIHAIQDGDASCALVGGCEVKTNLLGMIGLYQQKCFTPHSPEPDLTNDRTPPGEGAAFLVLESQERAEKRGADIYARIGPCGTETHDAGESLRETLLRLLGKDEVFGLQGGISSVVSSGAAWPETDPSVLEFLGVKPDQFIQPKRFLGDLFAAAAPVNLGLSAGHLRQNPAEKSLVASFGHGTEKGAFVLEGTQTPSLPRKSRPDSHEAKKTGRRRVVITGIGAVTPIGNDRETFWKNLSAGRSGIGPITLFDASSLMVRIGGEVKHFDRNSVLNAFPEAAKERDRKLFLGLAAAREAISDAGLPSFAGMKTTLHVGVSLEVFFLDDVTPIIHAPDLAQAMIGRFLRKDLDTSTAFPLQSPLDRLSDLIGDKYGIRGGRFTICSACAAGAQVVGEALRLLQRGDAEIAMAGAADSMLNPLGLGGFSLLRALSTENDHPQTACRPFDATRQGTVLGEGAAFLVLETLEHAEKRGARIYAELLGYGSSLDAYRVSDPEPGGRGAILSMKKALRDAGLESGQIDCINAHATGTPKNDTVETAAIKHVLGSRAGEIPVHSVKSMTGHLIGASGAVETAVAALTLKRDIVPPTINLRSPDPECDLDYVPDTARPFQGNHVLSNSFGFGGQNATLILKRF